MVDEQATVEVVDFVLDADGEQAVGLDFPFLVVAVEKPDPHPVRALDVLVIVRDRQAAFLVDLQFVGGPGDFRIGQTQRPRFLVVLAGDVDDDDALGNGNLNGGKADARRGIHGFQHVVHQRADFVVDAVDRFADETQSRIGQGDDVEFGHAGQIGNRLRRVNVAINGKIANCVAAIAESFYVCPMDAAILQIGTRIITVGEATMAVVFAALIVLVAMAIALWRGARARAAAEAAAVERGHELEARIADLLRTQSEMTGRIQTMAEVFGTRQSDLTKALVERLDGVGHRLGQSMARTTEDTHSNLRKLHERLAVIDNAQKSIHELTGQVTGLQQILANKQARGAFGQGRMEAIISDGLPAGSYSFQATLSNDRRPDCLIHMPNGAAALVVDAKFPLEGFSRFREAETPADRDAAAKLVRRDVNEHIKAIRERYFLPGETQDTAFLFVPSEALFADLHDHFDDLIQKAHRARIVIVSPALLVLSIQIVQTILRDVRMREEALVIQREVAHLVEDTNRLRDRVLSLQRHFGKASEFVDQILISSEKIVKRGGKIETLDFDDVRRDDEAETAPRSAAE